MRRVKSDGALLNSPGVAHVTTMVGFSLVSTVQTTLDAFFSMTLKPWEQRTASDE